MLLNSTDFYFYTKIYIFDILFNIIKKHILKNILLLFYRSKKIFKRKRSIWNSAEQAIFRIEKLLSAEFQTEPRAT